MNKLKRNNNRNTVFQIVKEYAPDRHRSNRNIKKNTAQQKAANQEKDDFFKIMEKDELKEKHFQEAITQNSSIPVPEIVEIDQNDYDRLYPANYTIPKIRIMVQPNDREIDYDVDSEDEEWLNENGKILSLTSDDFEIYMDYLEQKAIETKNPPILNDILSHFGKSNNLIAIEATYDYWLNKRLKLKGKSLAHNLKKEPKKVVSKNKYDPYIAFRQRPKRMNLRKNRSRDRDNYVKMLNIRQKIEECLNFYRTNAYCETAKHELLKLRFSTFQDQYRTGSFNPSYLEREVTYNSELLLKDLRENRIGYSVPKIESEAKSDDLDDVPMVEVKENENENELFPFRRLAHCEFNNIRNDYFDQNYVEEVDDNQKFHRTDAGLMRRRLGRGGRIIHDRMSTSESDNVSQDTAEYQQVDFYKKIIVKRYNNDGTETPGSAFTLQPALTCLDSTFSLNDLELVCSFEG